MDLLHLCTDWYGLIITESYYLSSRPEWRTELKGHLEYQDAFDYVSFAPSWFK